MPSYFYHLILELYSRPGFQGAQTSERTADIFLPPRSTDIFTTSLPAHTLPKHQRRKSYKESCCIEKPAIYIQAAEYRNRSGSRASDSFRGTRNQSELGLNSAKRLHKEAEQDWRYDRVAVESIDMGMQNVEGKQDVENPIEQGTATRAAPGGLATKGLYVPLNPKNTQVGWGVVHLYRDSNETPGLYNDQDSSTGSESEHGDNTTGAAGFDDEACTTLCILAVPSYMTPSDLLGFLGEQTRNDVSHFRLIRTGKSNKYMVLMKFREASKAKRWRKEWNGKLFNSMDAETCHVVFIKSIEFQTPETDHDPSNFPDMTNDPFTPAARTNATAPLSASSPSPTDSSAHPPSALSTKPFAPPTQSLVELPTCPVCLERMDETTGLLTILCQHVFHCVCLEKWRGSGCPVCRYTQNDAMTGLRGHALPGEIPDNECSVCGTTANLWICLICGNVGCGRYDSAHAFAHYEATSHSYAMDVATQHVWDYAGDGYVHRLIQNKSDGKLVDLPAALSSMNVSSNPNSAYTAIGADSISREKFENMSNEYTYLLTSQLDSQRRYFEEQLERAVDKASKASSAAEKAAETANSAARRLSDVQASLAESRTTASSLSKQLDRVEQRATRFEKMAREMGTQLKEEKTINESLMTRIKHLDVKAAEFEEKNKNLEELNRDMTFFISGQAKLKELEESGETGVAEGDVSLPESKKPGSGKKRKGKGKASGST
ncbi:MAG: hypothetical protein M1821_006123 [Bathelium mastoideum]|nr:MAG: hypothetical protein M1821_006123 [Bathelium mastoideum]